MKVCRCVDSLRFPESLLGAGNRSESGRENTYVHDKYQKETDTLVGVTIQFTIESIAVLTLISQMDMYKI